MELAPLRWDASTGQLVLARRLIVRLSFQGRDRNEISTDGVRGRRVRGAPIRDGRNVVARLAASEKGLYAIRYNELPSSPRRGMTDLRLSRQGEAVPFHLEPSSKRFGPGSTFYFFSEGADVNPYGHEAVYELQWGTAGETLTMPVVDSRPSGDVTSSYRKTLVQEQNQRYQASLLDRTDLWLWDLLFAPARKSYRFEVRAIAPSADPSTLTVWLQGASDARANPDHHVRVYVNGSLVTESSWDGRRPRRIDVELAPGAIREGENQLELENVGDTDARYSMVMLDRFELVYPATPSAENENGRLTGTWSDAGVAELTGLGAGTQVMDVTDGKPRWLTGSELGADGRLRVRVEAGRKYLAVSPAAVLHPRVTTAGAGASHLYRSENAAEYLVIGPEALVGASGPLLELRRSQGLIAKAVSVEDIYSAFGFGEPTPRAIRDFLGYAYHHWQSPSLKYVVLLGDATVDFKDYLGTGVTNQVPPWMARTTYLWTATDPTYAAVNGEDLLPDLALGRLPAANAVEARIMVDKILAYETGGASFSGPVVLVADNTDHAGDFEAQAEEIAASLLLARSPEKIYLSALGRAAARDAILETFDEGASLVSYLGHGGIHLWAAENLFEIEDVHALSPQRQQPLVLAMNCLNGYFHFPYLDSLSEELVKARDKGAIAAFSPSGLSPSGPAHEYHKALLAELVGGKHARLGDALLAAQRAYADTGAFPELLSIYNLLGDPALTLRDDAQAQAQ